jgi:hypothetical protein
MSQETRGSQPKDPVLRWFYRLLFSCVLFSSGIICGILLMYMNNMEIRRQNCEAYFAAPMPTNVVNDLCTRGLIPPQIGSCSTPSALQKKDITAIFEANIKEGETRFQQVTNMFGKYQDYCDPVTYRDEFRCTYMVPEVVATFIHYDTDTQVVRSMYVETCGGGGSS